MADFVLDSGALSVLFGLLSSAPLAPFGGYVVFVLVNLTVSRTKQMQNDARAQGAFEALERFLKWLDTAPEGSTGAFSLAETRRTVYDLLDNLLTTNATNTMQFIGRPYLVPALEKIALATNPLCEC
jgi:hypothetical protein